MKLLPFVFILLISCSSQTDFVKGKKLLEMQGFTNVENTGYSFFCCSDKDQFSTGFKATDKDGKIVRGCFCSAFFKGLTIRFE